MLTNDQLAIPLDTGKGLDLLCPECGSKRLKQSFSPEYRQFNEYPGITKITMGKTSFHFFQGSNHVTFTILFECKDCNWGGELVLMQHTKGTVLGWRLHSDGS